MRKLHQSVDAELWAVNPTRAEGGEGRLESAVELRYTFNGELTYRRVWGTRDEAMHEARAKRLELERDGWMFHW